jgi:urocanate hydratase
MWLLKRNLGGRKRGATAPQTRPQSIGALREAGRFGELEERLYTRGVVERSDVRADQVRQHDAYAGWLPK